MSNAAQNTNCVVLAAGEGKRMFAKHSKVLCEVTYKPMVLWVTDAAKHAGISDICVVVSSPDVEHAVGAGYDFAYQTERRGTGHAVMQAREFLSARAGQDTLVLYGDVPFIDEQTILESLSLHRDSGAMATVISAVLDDPSGYGRIVRKHGALAAIVEDADADDATKQIKEINSGAGWFNTSALLMALDELKPNNAQGEYYLTDVISILIARGEIASCYIAKTADITLGANRPLDLLNLNDIASERAIIKHLEAGVHFVKRDGVIIGPDVEIAPGATILPGSVLYGRCRVGAGAVIGPEALLKDVLVGENTRVNASQCYEAEIGAEVSIGPYVHIRPGTKIADHVKIGDFVEIKNSSIGEGTSIAHLTYIGDSKVGRYCNFGCGVVVVNYDGVDKHETVIKDFAFIGCNTNLIAPATVGEAAYTAAGATVIGEVPNGALLIDRNPATIKPGWAEQKLKAYIEKKQALDAQNHKDDK